MVAPRLHRGTSRGVTLLGDPDCPSGVTLAFTEREGGVSEGCYHSLNLHDSCGDDPANVRQNRMRALAAIGAEDLLDNLVCLRQVHGTTVVVVDKPGVGVERARAQAREGADAVVCTVPDVSALICTADCAPIALVAPGGFALVHSGWRGTMSRIVVRALRALLDATSASATNVRAYVGPHIRVDDYEVSPKLATLFANEFGSHVVRGDHVSLAEAIRVALVEEGVEPSQMVWAQESTASKTSRYFSYRAQGGACGRNGLVACMRPGCVGYENGWLDRRPKARG